MNLPFIVKITVVVNKVVVPEGVIVRNVVYFVFFRQKKDDVIFLYKIDQTLEEKD